MIDIEKLRTFYYVIKEGSLLKAASILEKNYTTLSKHLSDLEETYNVKLFTRQRKHLVLTDTGNELFKLAQSTIPNLENGATEILAPREQSNKLRIITTTGVMGVWLIGRIKTLADEFPDLQIAIMTTNADIDFETSKADVGILPKQVSKGLSQKKLKTFHFHLFASPDYIEKYGMPKNLEDLKNHKLISFYSDYEGNIGNVDWHLKKGMPEHTIRESYLSINSGFLVYEATCQGLGIGTMLKEFEYMNHSGLISVLPDDPGPIAEVFYVTRADRVLTNVQKRFAEILST